MFKKHHPKDWMKRGRIIVKLKKDDTTLIKGIENSNFKLILNNRESIIKIYWKRTFINKGQKCS